MLKVLREVLCFYILFDLLLFQKIWLFLKSIFVISTVLMNSICKFDVHGVDYCICMLTESKFVLFCCLSLLHALLEQRIIRAYVYNRTNDMQCKILIIQSFS